MDDARLSGGTWTVGGLRVTTVVEEQTDHIPPQLFFPAATAEDVRRHEWVVPDFADERGNIGLRVQAFVVETPTRVIVVDPCVGNGKTLSLPFWNDGNWPFLDRFAVAGFDPAQVDLVIHTHLHEDHVGWDTHRVGGDWVPTFTRARHLYVDEGLAHLRAGADGDRASVLAESVQPVFDAGLADVVTVGTDGLDLGEGLRLAPTPGHLPGHVSLWLESDGSRALISGDFVHHPVQLAEPDWAEAGDLDDDLARVTRRRMFTEAAEPGVRFFGTHFPTRSVGQVVADGDVWRFIPE